MSAMSIAAGSGANGLTRRPLTVWMNGSMTGSGRTHRAIHARRDERRGAEGDRATELRRKSLSGVVALEDAVEGTVTEHSFLPGLLREPRPPRLLDHDQARRHAQRLGDELSPLVLLLQVAVDVGGERDVERVVVEWERRNRRADEARLRHALAGDPKHRLALVDAHDLSAKQACEPAGAARDVESAAGWDVGDEGFQSVEVGRVVARAHELVGGCVVLGCAPLVVLLHPANTRRSASSITSARDGGCSSSSTICSGFGKPLSRYAATAPATSYSVRRSWTSGPSS